MIVRQRRMAPAWLVDQAALVAVAESRQFAQAAAMLAMAGVASFAIEKPFIERKAVPPAETPQRA